MPEIIGKRTTVTSSMHPIDGHISHLRHLTNNKVAKELLRSSHGLNATEATKVSKLWGAHIGQALNFYFESRTALETIRPVLQYYCYLNLSVAAILAFRPLNYTNYRRHGVEDKTYSLSSLDLSSIVLKVKQGAVPLFHSIISDVSLSNKRFRLGQLAGGFHMFSHEIGERFNKIPQNYYVEEEIQQDGVVWHSIFKFSQFINNESKKFNPKRIEDAMPLLKFEYDRTITNKEIVYKSTKSWKTKTAAQNAHKLNGIKFINYGGHGFADSMDGIGTPYFCWRGLSRNSLMPTLSSTLLLSFSLASIVRYRPMLIDSSMKSPISLLIATFVNESDAVFIPALRNLLYREEVSIGPSILV